jgi:hypothetical protein
MIRTLAAALFGLALSSAAPVVPDEPAQRFNAMTMIQCGAARGTAFWVGRRLLASAQHVTAGGPCRIGETPIATLHEDAESDFALLRGPANRARLPVTCRGFGEGRAYWATGWAQGLFRHTARLVATRERSPGGGGAGGLRILAGEVWPGMSGGPVVDRAGRVVGIVNRRAVAAPLVQSRPLRDTILCRGRRG